MKAPAMFDFELNDKGATDDLQLIQSSKIQTYSQITQKFWVRTEKNRNDLEWMKWKSFENSLVSEIPGSHS